MQLRVLQMMSLAPLLIMPLVQLTDDAPANPERRDEQERAGNMLHSQQHTR